MNLRIISTIVLALLIIGCNTSTIEKSVTTKNYTFKLLAVDEARTMNVEGMSQKDAEAVGDIILVDKYNEKQKYLLKSKSIIDRSMIADAQVGIDEYRHGNLINIQFTKEGAEIFSDFTSKNNGKRVAIVLNSKVYSAPIIAQTIPGGTVQITGDFSTEEAFAIVNSMKSKKEKQCK